MEYKTFFIKKKQITYKYKYAENRVGKTSV